MWNDLFFRLRAIFRRSAVESELDDEVRFHLEHLVQRYIRGGMSRDAAERQARLEFGGTGQVKDECRQARGISALEILWRDLRYGARALVKNSGFTAVAVLTLAIGIGANTAIFSVVNAALLRPLPYPDPQRLVMLWGTSRTTTGDRPFSDLNFLEYQAQNRAFESMATLGSGGITLTATAEPERIAAGSVSPDFFQVLKVQPLLGRTFQPEDGQPGQNAVTVLTYGTWQRRYGSDPNMVGRQISMNQRPYTVIGVLPPTFDFSIPGYFQPKELYVPAVLKRDETQRGNNYLRVIARVRPGVSAEQAQADLDGISIRLARQFPQMLAGQTVRLITLQDQSTGGVRRILWILLAAVFLVLLIACANVANLQLARASARQKEIAIRTAMGAGRRRVMGQLLTESLLLATVGGLFGWALAWVGLRGLAAIAPQGLPGGLQSMDWLVLAYSLGVSLLAGVLFGLAPALQSSAGRLSDTLKQGGRSSGESRGGGRLRSTLMVAEVALSLVLLAGAGLLIRSFVELLGVKPGFETRNVLTLPITLPGYAYPTDARRAAFYRSAVERMAAIPGVLAVGAIDDLPLTSDRDSSSVTVEGSPVVEVNQRPVVQQRSVTPDYFRAMRIPLLAGHVFSEADTVNSPPVALINQEAARRIFHGRNPVGRRITFGVPSAQSTWMTITGVVGDVRDLTLDARPEMELFQPYQQSTIPYMTLVMRTTGDPATVAAAARAEFHALDKDLPVYPARPMETILAVSIEQRRFNMLLLSLFAAVALALAAVGIYGVVSYSVAQRTSEIGLRMALGAARGQVLKLVIGRSLALTAAGLAFGLAAAAGLTSFLSTMLYGVRATDPWTFAGVSLLLAAVATIASYVPARRAMKVDPMTALRNE